MQLVTEIHFYNKTKARVKLDSGFTFALYKSEIRKYNIMCEKSISDKVLQNIIDEILVKRAKERALYLLQYSQRTENEIIQKLTNDYYPKIVVDQVIAMLKKYNYINDYEFSQNYIESMIGRKSIKEIKVKLLQKGVPNEIVNAIIGDLQLDEKSGLEKLVHKKIDKYDLTDIKQRNRFFAMLIRRGYKYDDVNQILNELHCL